MKRMHSIIMMVGLAGASTLVATSVFAGSTEAVSPAEAPAAPAPTAPAPAPAAETPSPWTANVSIVSQYVSRGLRQTWGGPAIQGGIDYANPNGWSAGTWLSNVSGDEFAGASTEQDIYGGYTKKFSDDLSAGAIFYHYRYANANYNKQCFASAASQCGVGNPANPWPDKKYDYNEIVPQFTYKWFTLKDWISVGDYFGYNSQTLGQSGPNRGSSGSQYLDANINYDLSKFNHLKNVTLLLHVGHENVRNHTDFNWTDYKVGLSKTFGTGWNAGIAYTKAHAPKFENFESVAGNGERMSLGKGTLLVSVGRTF